MLGRGSGWLGHRGLAAGLLLTSSAAGHVALRRGITGTARKSLHGFTLLAARCPRFTGGSHRVARDLTLATTLQTSARLGTGTAGRG